MLIDVWFGHCSTGLSSLVVTALFCYVLNRLEHVCVCVFVCLFVCLSRYMSMYAVHCLFECCYVHICCWWGTHVGIHSCFNWRGARIHLWEITLITLRIYCLDRSGSCGCILFLDRYVAQLLFVVISLYCIRNMLTFIASLQMCTEFWSIFRWISSFLVLHHFVCFLLTGASSIF